MQKKKSQKNKVQVISKKDKAQQNEEDLNYLDSIIAIENDRRQQTVAQSLVKIVAGSNIAQKKHEFLAELAKKIVKHAEDPSSKFYKLSEDEYSKYIHDKEREFYDEVEENKSQTQNLAQFRPQNHIQQKQTVQEELKSTHEICNEKIVSHVIINNKASHKDKLKDGEMIKASNPVNTTQSHVQFQPTSPKMTFGERKNKWDEKQKLASRTSSLASNEERKRSNSRSTVRRDETSGSRIRDGKFTGMSGVVEKREASGARTLEVGSLSVHKDTHPTSFKSMQKSLKEKEKASNLTREDQLKKREAILSNKFGGMMI